MLKSGSSGLVLQRFVDEEIVIGGIIRITVASIRSDRVRLHIDAPREIAVHRGEIEREANAAERQKISVEMLASHLAQ